MAPRRRQLRMQLASHPASARTTFLSLLLLEVLPLLVPEQVQALPLLPDLLLTLVLVSSCAC